MLHKTDDIIQYMVSEILNTRKKAAYRPLFPRPCGQLLRLRPTCLLHNLRHEVFLCSLETKVFLLVIKIFPLVTKVFPSLLFNRLTESKSCLTINSKNNYSYIFYNCLGLLGGWWLVYV